MVHAIHEQSIEYVYVHPKKDPMNVNFISDILLCDSAVYVSAISRYLRNSGKRYKISDIAWTPADMKIADKEYASYVM